MKVKNDSLLIKIIFYNDVAIFLTSIIIALVVILLSFQDMNKRIESTAKNKTNLLISSYTSYFRKIRNDIYIDTSKYRMNMTDDGMARAIKYRLLRDNFKGYYETIVTIVSEYGELIDEYGNDENIYSFNRKQNNELIKISKLKRFEKNGYFLSQINDKIYAEVVIPYGDIFNIYYIIISIPINNEFLNLITSGLELEARDKITFISNIDNKLITKKFFSKKIYKEIVNKKCKTYYFNKMINGLSYYIGVYNLLGYDDEYLGSFVIALSKEKLIEEKFKTFIYISILVFLAMAISSTISSKLLKKLLLPLSQIADTADKISREEGIKEVEVLGVGEIRTLSLSFKGMVEKLNIAYEKLQHQNKELMKNIERIDAIDKLLLGMNIEKDTYQMIEQLLLGFVSEVGLGYSRAMYFRYSRENDYLIGEEVYTNINLKENSEKGFKFQVDRLKEVISLTKIPINTDNLLSKSFKERKIIYRNDVGYRYNLGNDILKSIGLKNFFVFPIYGAGKYSGVVVVDNYIKNIMINQEELELLNLLAMNFSVGINNKEQGISVLENERVLTIEKLASRFLRLRGDVVDKLLECLNSDYPAKHIIDELELIKSYLIRIKDDNRALKSYVDEKDDNYKVISLDKIINAIINEYREKLKKQGILISFFSVTSGKIYGSQKHIIKVIKELLNNSYMALLERKNDRRIEIILSKRKINQKIELKIIDNGKGMSIQQIKDIYEPFISYFPQTLGLGLFFAQKTIKDHKGVIKHFSELGKGTEVKITLNAYKEEV